MSCSTYLEDVVLGVTILVQLILEGITVEAHFQFTSVFGNLLDEIHPEGETYILSGDHSWAVGQLTV